ncbi:MAG: TetR family transcriptional regulator [Nocardioides sp.]|uniref:TetR family transcriptional regulator n=1 Tax=Nocardioides sp. TaxID=35761 RepID=UPI0039E300BE
MSAGTETLRDLARNAVREEVSRHAWELFASQGFEATTVDQIAEAAGMSRRTFFRYFSGKDELVSERLVESGGRVAAALAARPASETPWQALRAAFDAVVVPQENLEQARRIQLMLRDEPSARPGLEEWRRRWSELLAPQLVERLDDEATGESELRAGALVACAISCLEQAQRAWATDADASLGEVLDVAMSAIAPLD